MKGYKVIGAVIGLILVALGAFLFFGGHLSPKQGGILIESTPGASVYINDTQVGHTPYESTKDPGEISVKIVPESFDKALAPFETKVTIVSGVKTVVRREFGETDDLSQGEIISFEKIGRGETSLAIVSLPDAAQIAIDNQVRGFTPYKTSNITSGEHQITITAPNALDRKLSIKAVSGYKLTAVVKLSINGNVAAAVTSAQPSPTPAPTEEKIQYVEILSTPTGFLRVRATASTSASEVGQVKPGQKYILLEEDDKSEWFKIQFEKDKEGWISSQYAKKVEAVPSPSPSVKASPTATPKATR